MSKIKDYLFHAWTRDPVQLSSDPDSVNGKLHKGRWRVLKIGATVGANVLSFPQDMIGLATGAVAGVAAGLVGVAKAFFYHEDCKKAFSKMGTKGATAGAIGGTIVGSVFFFPLSITSYGLSWLTARKGEISRSHLMINIALRALNKNDAPVEETAGPPATDKVLRSFTSLIEKIGPYYKLNTLENFYPKSDWWRDNMSQSIVRGDVKGIPFIAIRIVQVNQVDPKDLVGFSKADYWTEEQEKFRRIKDVTPRDGESIITFCQTNKGLSVSSWDQGIFPEARLTFAIIELLENGNVSDRVRLGEESSVESFDRLMRLVNGEEITQEFKGISLTWKLWTPPLQTKSARTNFEDRENCGL